MSRHWVKIQSEESRWLGSAMWSRGYIYAIKCQLLWFSGTWCLFILRICAHGNLAGAYDTSAQSWVRRSERGWGVKCSRGPMKRGEHQPLSSPPKSENSTWCANEPQAVVWGRACGAPLNPCTWYSSCARGAKNPQSQVWFANFYMHEFWLNAIIKWVNIRIRWHPIFSTQKELPWKEWNKYYTCGAEAWNS